MLLSHAIKNDKTSLNRITGPIAGDKATRWYDSLQLDLQQQLGNKSYSEFSLRVRAYFCALSSCVDFAWTKAWMKSTRRRITAAACVISGARIYERVFVLTTSTYLAAAGPGRPPSCSMVVILILLSQLRARRASHRPRCDWPCHGDCTNVWTGRVWVFVVGKLEFASGLVVIPWYFLCIGSCVLISYVDSEWSSGS